MRPLSPRHAIPLATVALLASAPAAAQNPTLNEHPVRLDAEGKLLSWYDPQARAYDFVATRPWAFLAAVPVQPNGFQTFYTAPTLDPATGGPAANPFHNPAGLFAMLADGAALHYAYNGDGSVVELVKGVLDHMLEFGTTPPDWAWPRVPYASSDTGAVRYEGGDDTKVGGNGPGGGDGRFVIEPDKVGELGLGYLQFWQLTGDRRYLSAALSCADALAGHVRPGDATHSPWPFRVRADTGAAVEEYTAHAVAPVKLFDAAIRAGVGETLRYRAALETAWSWVLRHPVQNGLWAGYFEDVPTMPDPAMNLNQYVAMETARFMMLRPEYDPEWRTHVPRLLAFVEETFGQDQLTGAGLQPGIQYGARAIGEQFVTMEKLGSHTSRYASVLARWSELTGDAAAREGAYRSLNWATYMCSEEGLVDVSDDFGIVWFTDGYGDYTRHYLRAMGSVPEWAPPGEAHLLRSSSIVSRITYGDRRIDYRTFDEDATEVLRLPAEPSRILAGWRPLPKRTALTENAYSVEPVEGGDVVVRVRHTGHRNMTIEYGDSPRRSGDGGCSTSGDGGVAALLLLVGSGVRFATRSPTAPRPLRLRQRPHTARVGSIQVSPPPRL